MLASQKEAPENTKVQDDIRLWKRLGPGRSFSGHERDRLFTRLVPGKPLVDTGGISGMDLVGDGRSAVYADFDGDGDLDLLVRQIQIPKLSLFRNDGPTGGSIEVRVSGRAMGLNATVTAKVGERTFVRQVLAGTGFLSQKPLAIHVGLGGAAKADSVEIKFLSGKVVKAVDVPAGSRVLAREDAEAPEIQPRPAARVFGVDPPKDDMRHLGTSASMAGALTEAATAALGERLKRSAAAKPLLVNLWAPWCKPCAKEMPALEAWARAHPEVEVVGLSVDGTDDEVAKAAQKLGASFPVGAFAPGAAARLNLDAALPASFWFGPDGKLVRGWLGAVDFASFKAP
ncbi:MAG TPA: ASPIC/UnbV domain-containing protein [Myxococcales bacterium]